MDDVIIVKKKDTDVENKLRMLNSMDEHNRFMVEEEVGGKLPIFDTMLQSVNDGLKFSTCRKPTIKADFMNFLSPHDWCCGCFLPEGSENMQ